MILYYIRHGDPIYSEAGLTELGFKQADALAERLALSGIDEIYSSPSPRAIKTAMPLSKAIKKPINKLDWCNEDIVWNELVARREDGSKTWLFYDKSSCEKFRTSEVLSLGKEWYKCSFFGPEIENGIRRIDKETDEFLKKFGFVHNREKSAYTVTKSCDKRIALFAHQGFGMAFLSSLLDIPYPVFSTHFDISHSGFSVIYFPDNCGEEIVPKMLQHSNDSHLFKKGLPTKYNNSIDI